MEEVSQEEILKFNQEYKIALEKYNQNNDYFNKKENGKSTLKYFGWYPNRCVDISSTLELFKEWNIETFQTGIDFLKEFNYIDITGTHKFKDFTSDYTISINPLFGISCGWECDNIPKYIGKKIIPIGSNHYDNLTFFFAEDGEIYGWFDGYLSFLGHDIFEAIYNLVFSISMPYFCIW